MFRSGHALNRASRPLTPLLNGRRHYTVGIIGAGITGLSAAFRLLEDAECTGITVYEKDCSLGGWIQSETEKVDGGHVVFETGPRTLKAPSMKNPFSPLLDLIVKLEMQDDLVLTGKQDPATTNRYIYYPDRLMRMPGAGGGFWRNVWDLWKLANSPLGDNLMEEVYNEPEVPPPEPYPEDESVTQFLSRRLSSESVDKMFSAFFHGIYAGNTDCLSAKTLMGMVREIEATEGSIIMPSIRKAFMRNELGAPVLMDEVLAARTVQPDRDALIALMPLLRRSSVLTFRHGLHQLIDRLVAALNKSGRVKIITEADITSISQNEQTRDMTISHVTPRRSQKHQTFDRVIAAHSPGQLANILGQSPANVPALREETMKSLQANDYAVTVAVVNLYYENPNLLPVNGFGYLIPRGIPIDQNPELALGVIFGSATSQGQDTAPGTKLTVILGGHYWDGWSLSEIHLNYHEMVDKATSLLKRHLGITERPRLTNLKYQRQAIPQYTVGHEERLREMSRCVRQDFGKRLTLAGNWYGGVSVPDCIRQGYIAATFGVGAKRLRSDGSNCPWSMKDSSDWDLEGGVAVPPVRWERKRLRR